MSKSILAVRGGRLVVPFLLLVGFALETAPIRLAASVMPSATASGRALSDTVGLQTGLACPAGPATGSLILLLRCTDRTWHAVFADSMRPRITSGGDADLTLERALQTLRHLTGRPAGDFVVYGAAVRFANGPTPTLYETDGPEGFGIATLADKGVVALKVCSTRSGSVSGPTWSTSLDRRAIGLIPMRLGGEPAILVVQSVTLASTGRGVMPVSEFMAHRTEFRTSISRGAGSSMVPLVAKPATLAVDSVLRPDSGPGGTK